ncbi:SRPBCC family protein [Actinosynnema sp. NPDC047251]|uniref:SRPBCC family protein n=1 Tax=Saccharothrix espanaensis TaxID=103731 RepID=UPI0002F25D7E|nr:SRPBCC family protein [Saccharothrix espanaensis]
MVDHKDPARGSLPGAKAPGTSTYLGVYLNDHLAGASANVELARRVARTHPGLRGLAREVAEDRTALLRIMKERGVPVSRHKVAAGRLGELVGRLKLNGSLVTRSPLSDLVELEAMRLGIEAKAALWRALRTLPDTDTYDRLLERAESQARRVEALRLDAAAGALSARTDRAGVEVGRTFAVRTPPERVHEYLRDFAHAEQWDPGTVSCEPMEPGPVEVGTRWHNVSQFLGRRVELVYELTRDDPEHLQFVGANRTATSTDDITVTPGPAPGTSSIHYRAHVEFHGLARFGAPLARLGLEKLATEMESSLPRALGGSVQD